MCSGDEDPSVQWRGSELAVRNVGLPEVDGGGWRPWFVVEDPVSLELLSVKSPEWGPTLSAHNRRGQDPALGGYIEEFAEVGGSGGTLSFATVRNVGHLVPQHRPQAALHLFERTMQAAVARRGAPPALSPPLSKAVTTSGSDMDFYGDGEKPGAMGRWLAHAASPAWTSRHQVSKSFAKAGVSEAFMTMEKAIMEESGTSSSMFFLSFSLLSVVFLSALVIIGARHQGPRLSVRGFGRDFVEAGLQQNLLVSSSPR